MEPTISRRVRPKTVAQIAAEWDTLASDRLRQIDTGIDSTYNNVLAPAMIDVCTTSTASRVLDVGCGVGRLTRELARYYDNVVGIDPSRISIETAQAHNSAKNIRYVHASVEELSLGSPGKFGLVVANMSLMATPSLETALASIARLLTIGGQLTLSVPHPCFWPLHRGFANQPWFDYKCEMFIESAFSLSSETLKTASTYIHRPLARYIQVLSQNGFILLSLEELSLPLRESTSTVGTIDQPKFLLATAKLPGSGERKNALSGELASSIS